MHKYDEFLVLLILDHHLTNENIWFKIDFFTENPHV